MVERTDPAAPTKPSALNVPPVTSIPVLAVIIPIESIFLTSSAVCIPVTVTFLTVISGVPVNPSARAAVPVVF